MKFRIVSLFIVSISFIFTSCVDRDFDAPPILENADPNIPEGQIISISDVLSLREAGENFHDVDMDMYIRAIVTADDQSGNFYKSIVIEDETAGITILLDDVELWNKYFVGRRVFVHLKNIWVGEFNGLPQLGFEPFDNGRGLTMARIPADMIPSTVITGLILDEPLARTMQVADITASDYNTLITIENMQFNEESVNTTFADAENAEAIDHTIEDCDGNALTLRTSGFAEFADQMTPTGKGSVTGIISVYNSTRQFLIRDLIDIDMTGDRCSAALESSLVSIETILARRIAGEDVEFNSGEVIKGQIISSDETGNFFKSITIADETGGIAVLVDATNTYNDYPLGSIFYLKLNGLYISDFNALPQLGYTQSNANVSRIPESLLSNYFVPTIETQALTPKLVALTELNEGMLNTYVQLDDIQFTTGSLNDSYADANNQVAVNHQLEDCNGNKIIIRTSGYSEFAGQTVPSDNGSITGVLQIYQEDYQIYLNFSENVNFDKDRCP